METKDEDVVLGTLKARYFDLLKTEKIPKTPQLTEKIDKLEVAINIRIKELETNAQGDNH